LGGVGEQAVVALVVVERSRTEGKSIAGSPTCRRLALESLMVLVWVSRGLGEEGEEAGMGLCWSYEQ
jgi:hypothetical protein